MPNRIACRKVAGQLPDYAAGRLPAAEREPLSLHLATCAACRSELEGYRRTIQLMADAGQSALPASHTDWQMLVTYLVAARPSQRASTYPLTAYRRLALPLAGAAVVALIGLGFKTALSRRPGNSVDKETMTAWLSPRPSDFKRQLPLPPATQRQDAALPFNPDMRAWSTANNVGARSPRPSGTSGGKRRDVQPKGDSLSPAQVQRLLAQAARKIDALENAPPSQDERQALAALLSAAQPLPGETPSSIQITVQAKDQTLLDNRVAFVPAGKSGGTWVRQTLLERPNGDRTTETVVAVMRPDSSPSFINLQTCAPANRHQYGDIQP